MTSEQSEIGHAEKMKPSQKLLEARNDILAKWELRLRREVKGAADMSHAVLINTLPLFLGNLAEVLAGDRRNNATEGTNIPEEHGGARARLSKYGPDQLVQEYQILREVILDVLWEHVSLTREEYRVIESSIDNGLRESMAQFFSVQSWLNEVFVATVTHDMRNPLSANKLVLELISKTVSAMEESETKQKLTNFTERALRSVKRVDRMIQDLLDSKLIQSGDKLVLKIAETDICQVIEEALSCFSPTDLARVEVSAPSIRGFWDLDAIRRAIENLLSNALKYGDDSKRITIRAARAFERLQVAVHNYGNPIPFADQAGLFRAFYRTRSAKESGKNGWGIGLSLTKAVTDAHGGSLVLQSDLERGTTFTLDIPMDSRPFQANEAKRLSVA